jgi:hypothetical protein
VLRRFSVFFYVWRWPRGKLLESLFLYLKIQLIYRPNENNNGPCRERRTRQFQKLAFLHCGKSDSPTLYALGTKRPAADEKVMTGEQEREDNDEFLE